MVYCVKCHAAKWLHGATSIHALSKIAGERIVYPTACEQFVPPSLWRRVWEFFSPEMRARRKVLAPGDRDDSDQ